MNMIRFFSGAAKEASKSGYLAQLRKRTGFPLVNCRKALQVCDNDLEKAEEWLKAEAKKLGWEKAMRLQNRIAKEGLIGITKIKNKAVMVEVNCETDFVARNEKFQSLVELVVNTCLTYPIKKTDSNGNKVILKEKELSCLLTAENEKLSDCVARHIALIGEKIVLRRAMCYERKDVQLDIDIHPPNSEQKKILTGKYGSFIALQRFQKNIVVDADMEKNLGVNLCKHIIGMNPKKIGNPLVDKPLENAEEEEVLVNQEFMLNPAITVAELLEEHAAKILDYERFQCGEEEYELQENEAQINAKSN